MADAQVVIVPNPLEVASGDWVVNADGVLEPAVAAPICLPQGVLKTSVSVALAASVNDFDPGGAGSLAVETVFIATSAPIDGGLVITGLVAPVLTGATPADKAPRVRFFNGGGGPIVLPDGDVASVAANRFDTSLVMGGGRGPVTILPGELAELLYDRGGSRWLVLAPIARKVGVSLQTTDATVTEIYNSGPLGVGQVLKILAELSVARTGSLVGRGGFVRQATFFRDGAAATAREGQIQTSFTRDTPNQIETTFILSGNAVSVVVEGRAGETYNWRGRVASDYAET